MQDGKYRVVLVSYILWNFLFFSPFLPQLLLQSGYLSSSVFLIYWPGIRSILMKWELAVMFPVSPSFSIYFIFRSSLWQDIPGVTGKFGLGVQNETGQKLKEFCQENALVITDTFFQQHKRRLYTWTSPDGQYRNKIDYVLCSQRWRSSIQSAKTRRGADCGLDHALFIVKCRLNLKKVGKTIKPFRYDLNQIP